jgi:hypothetical protein
LESQDDAMTESSEPLAFATTSEALGTEFHALLEASPDAMVVVNAAGTSHATAEAGPDSGFLAEALYA